jgi:hypothetical protein
MYLIKETNIYSLWSRDTTVGIATGYGLNDREVGTVKNVLFSTSSRPVQGHTQLLVPWVKSKVVPMFN